MKIANKEVDITPERLLEIAQMAIDYMFEYDRHEAIEVCRTEFTDTEWNLFGIDLHNRELVDEGYYENPYTGEQLNPRTMEIIQQSK